MGKNIVYTATYRNFLIGPNYFASLRLFTIIAVLNVARRLEGYRYMLGRRNIAANDIVCPVLALERLRSEIDTDTFIANDNLMKV